MTRKLFALCLLLLMLTRVAHAQPGGRVQRLVLTANAAEVVKDDDGGLVLVVSGGLPDGCESDITINTERIGVAWFIDMYRELPLDAICPAVMGTYEQRIDASALLKLDDDATLPLVLIINGKIYGVNHAQIQDTGNAGPAPLLDEHWVRSDVRLESITITQKADGKADLSFSIHQTDGCAQAVYRAYGVWDQEGLMRLEVYNIIRINASCLMIDETRDFSVNDLMFYTLSVNGVSLPHNTATSAVGSTSFVIQDMGVERADVGWVKMAGGSDPTVIIRVTGTTDGCEFPIQIALGTPVDNTYTVKVVRALPPDTACTMIAREFTVEQTFSLKLAGDAPLTFVIGDQTIVLDAQ